MMKMNDEEYLPIVMKLPHNRLNVGAIKVIIKGSEGPFI